MKELEIAGLRVGTAGKLFKVESIGEYERASYRLIAYVDMPIKPQPPEKKKKTNNDINKSNIGITDTPQSDLENQNDVNNQGEPEDPNDANDPNNDKKKKKPTELMEPRVIEIRIN